MENIFINFNNNKMINTIIIPGYLKRVEDYNSIIQLLNKYCNVIFFNIFENGFNPNFSLEDYSSILNGKISNLDNIILFGHSFGGRIIFQYCTLYKNNYKLILMDVAGIKYQSLKTIFKIKKYKLLKLFIKDNMKLLYKNSSKEYINLNSHQRKRFNEIINQDFKYNLKSLNNETLIIWGEYDKTTPLKIGKIIHKKLKDSGLVIIPKAKHFPHLENPFYFNIVFENYYHNLEEGVLSKL